MIEIELLETGAPRGERNLWCVKVNRKVIAEKFGARCPKSISDLHADLCAALGAKNSGQGDMWIADEAATTQGADARPFANCRYRICDLPGQCRDEGHCHHPASGERGDAHGRLQTENNALVHETERLRERLAEDDPAALWAEIYSLREQLKGPDGFATWKDAAIHERQLRGADARPVAIISEPVAWMVTNVLYGSVSFHTEESEAREFKGRQYKVEALAVAVEPPPPLTDEEIDAVATYNGHRNAAGGIYESRVREFARDILAEAIAPREKT